MHSSEDQSSGATASNGVRHANGKGMAPTTLKKPVVCVFCGASPGTSASHLAAARALAQSFHDHSISLVYGGGTVGIMGELARTLVSLSGPTSVHGIIPMALMKFEQKYSPSEHGQDASHAIDETLFGRTTIVSDMHTRKKMMCTLVQEGGPGSGFIALTGGFGTLEELMEMTTWNQLGIHDRGIVVLNVNGYWDGLLRWVRDAVKAGFISQANGQILVEATNPEDAVEALRNYTNSKERFSLEWGKDST